MKRIKKRLLGLMLLGCLTSGICMSASAYEYDFTFKPPFANCVKDQEISTHWRRGTDGPYVSPAGTTTMTTY